MVVAKKYVLVKRSEGFPKPSDFKLVEEQLPPLKENGKNWSKNFKPMKNDLFFA